MFDDFRREDPQDLAALLSATALPDTVYQLLVRTAAAQGGREAWHFIDSGRSRSWREVLALVERTAAALAGLGVGEGSHVAMMATTIEAFPLVWLALSRLGGALVPINSRYTAGEVDYALATADADFFLVEDALSPVLETLARPGIPDERVAIVGRAAAGRFRSWDALLAAAAGPAPPPARPDPERVLNLQFTSGTTGFSKACLLSNRYWLTIGFTHRAIVASELRRLYANLSFFYMVSQRILVQALFDGACVVFPRTAAAGRFVEDVVGQRCDYATPLLALTKLPPHPDERRHGVRIAMSGLGNLAGGVQSAFHRRFAMPLQNVYGLTETGVATYVPAYRILELEDSGTIGLPPPNREVRIAGPAGEALPPGQVGEIRVRGPGMLQGYYGMPEATAAVFDGDWFRTGDLGWVDGAGLFHLVGRSKDMVRRGGENVSAVEVETVLRQLPGVVEAAVVPVPDPVTEEEVKAYVQLLPGVTPEALPPERILEHCAGRLAPFKVPRYLEYREGFPLTESFRVQKKKLLAEKADLRSGSYDRRLGAWL